MDTIFALATARGKAGVAIVRLSGPAAFSAAESLCGPLPEIRRASLRRIVWKDEILDEALITAFAPGASFTGEQVIEIALHGSQAVVQSVLRALGEVEGLRLAEPGEFTRRALENGRLDLTQVEGLADLIDAETESQRRQAFRVLSGAIGARAEGWRRQLVRAAALIEATIDFADEEVPEDVRPEVTGILSSVLTELRTEIQGSAARERLREGYEVAIVGAPNAGKSTLLNAFAGREAALTSEIPGTTRDVIEVRLDLRGLAVTFLDTAGLRETIDPVEKLGVDRAVKRADSADLRVFLMSDDFQPSLEIRDDDIVVNGKADLTGVGVSGLTGQGVTELLDTVADRLQARVPASVVSTRQRHRNACERAVKFLEPALSAVVNGGYHEELVAADLRQSIRALESLVGRVDVEDLLGEIFASFCIGK